MTTQNKNRKKSTLIWLAAIISAIVCVAALLIWLLSSFHIVGGRLYDKDEYFVIDGTAYSNAEYFELDGKAYDLATHFEIDGVAYDYESSFEFEGASYPRSEYFTAGDRLYDFATYFCLNDTAYAHADYFLLGDTAYDRAEWFEHDGTAYKHSEHYVAHDRLYEIKEITLGGKTFMSDVTELELRDCGITDISVLADCGKLEKLDLGSEWSGNAGRNRIEDISALSELYGLKYLDLSANLLTDISSLAELDSLEHLNLEHNRVLSLNPLASLVNLTHLDVSTNSWLELHGERSVSKYGFDDLSPISGLTELTYLDVSENAINGLQLEPLSGLKKLEWLDISVLHRPNGAVLDITPIGNLTELTELRAARDNPMTGFEALDSLRKLVHLNLLHSKIEDLTPIANMKELKYLNLGYCFDVSDISALAELDNLKFLHLGATKVSNLEILRDKTSLECLGLYVEGVVISDYSPLYTLSNLQVLLVDKSCSREQIITLKNCLPDCDVGLFNEIDIGLDYSKKPKNPDYYSFYMWYEH